MKFKLRKQSQRDQTSWEFFGADQLAEKVLRYLRFAFTICDPVAEPESYRSRFLRVLFCLGTHEKYAELEC